MRRKYTENWSKKRISGNKNNRVNRNNNDNHKKKKRTLKLIEYHHDVLCKQWKKEFIPGLEMQDYLDDRKNKGWTQRRTKKTKKNILKKRKSLDKVSVSYILSERINSFLFNNLPSSKVLFLLSLSFSSAQRKFNEIFQRASDVKQCGENKRIVFENRFWTHRWNGVVMEILWFNLVLLAPNFYDGWT